jgi:ParB family chromosome partitioning protein
MLARDIVERGLNVRQVEAMASREGRPQARAGKRKSGGKDADTTATERRVSDALGLAVTIDHRGKGGVVHIAYNDLEQLDHVLHRLART